MAHKELGPTDNHGGANCTWAGWMSVNLRPAISSSSDDDDDDDDFEEGRQILEAGERIKTTTEFSNLNATAVP